jgi:hypothetical protein
MPAAQSASTFRRRFFDSGESFMAIGGGSVGGKAEGLALFREILHTSFKPEEFPEFDIDIPTLSVIRTDIFDIFLERNRLREIAASNESDDHIAHAFQKADLPVEIVGDLRALVNQVHQPLAVRSSSMLEDSLNEPFAGIYETKMIPNNQLEPDIRFRKLTEAIKFVYATTFFKAAKDYRKATGHGSAEEKMAVIIQEVVGSRYADRFYPAISGVARSFNFYPMGKAKPNEGVISLALGLGKTIVDGGNCWTYSPAYPKTAPPYGSMKEWLRQTQTTFWAVNMGKPPAYDPIRETEYLIQCDLAAAETDETLHSVASTYNAASDRITIGTGVQGPRVVTFAPVLVLNEPPLNALIRRLLAACEETVGSPVEIEFALTLKPLKFGCLQVRPMVVSDEQIDVSDNDLRGPNTLAASDWVMGNGQVDSISDVLYVKPDGFEAKNTPQVAQELETINRALLDAGRPYLLIGFGRWGSSDPWLGIPVNWGQVSGARVIVEATLPAMNVELSQGSHFFHNITSFRVSYFSVRHTGPFTVDWQWLKEHTAEHETTFCRHVRLSSPLSVKVDGRTGRGSILKTASHAGA